MQTNQQFENWYYSQKSLVQPDFPMASELLYHICNENPSYFDRVNTYLQLAFEAGQKCKQV